MVNSSDKKSKNSNKPTHTAFHVEPGKDGNYFWNKIGVAWTHDDGNGMSIQLSTMPLDGYIRLRQVKEKSE